METERPDYDQALKRLLTQAHDGVVALLLPQARWLGEVSPELHASKRQADLVWQVALPGGEVVLLHIELQTHPDPTMGERIADYALRLWREHRRPVHSVVVYLRETRTPLPDTFVLPGGGGSETLRVRFQVVRLWELPASAVLGQPEAALWPLAALMADATAAAVSAVAEHIAQANLARRERSELLGLLAVLAGARLPRDVVSQIVRRSPMLRELMEESSYTQLVREEAEARGEERGRAEGMRAMVQAVLEHRFGTLQTDEVAALQGADAPRLQEVATQMLDASREQLRALFGLTAQS